MELKEIIPNLNEMVIYNGSPYVLKASVVSKDNDGNLRYQAVIKDLKANSISYVKLEDVECESQQ